jgi:hypothetical protein
VSDADLKRMADAAHRINAQSEKLSLDRAAVMDWLKDQHAERGLVRLARDLGEDKANFSKVIKGERKPAKALSLKVRRTIENQS